MAKTIIALATPPLKGALALLRVSGDDAFAITDKLLKTPISGIKERSLLYRSIYDGDSLVDEVMLLVYPAPNSMTGEDVVEISCHGSMVIVEQIVSLYLSHGARYATRGEFSSRAFYNGKMDLIEAEAVNDLINATTVEAKNVALLSLSGQTSELLSPLKERLGEMLGLIEVGIDYPEYDEVESATLPDIAARCKSLREQIQGWISQGKEGLLIRQGVKVALVGQPNVGKSSLLNALLKQDKAIVSPIPGTTRDVVEGDLSIRGIPVHLLDTAGIRESEDQIEALGVERSRRSIEEADLVVVVLDASKKNAEDEELLRATENKKRIIIYNKSDLLSEKEAGKRYVSASEGDVGELKEAIFEALGIHEDAYLAPSFSNARELGLLKEIESYLALAEQDAENEATMDLISHSLQLAYAKVKELFGEEATQDLEDEIFSRFCVGK